METAEITRDVVLDLLPLYQAGEASPDSVRLVESYLDRDPELARRATADPVAALAPAPALAPEHEARTLERTRRLLRRDRWLMAGGIFFSILPLSGAQMSGGVDVVLLRDAPLVAVASLLVGLGFWLAFVLAMRRARI